jgi:hypothetical protein
MDIGIRPKVVWFDRPWLGEAPPARHRLLLVADCEPLTPLAFENMKIPKFLFMSGEIFYLWFMPKQTTLDGDYSIQMA